MLTTVKFSAPFQGGASQGVAGEGEGGDAHHLEPDEQVEQVVGQAEADHAGHEQQRQDVEVGVDLVVIAPGEDQGGGEEQADEGGEGGAGRVDDEADAEHQAVARGPAAEPVDQRRVHAGLRHGQAGGGGGERGEDGDDVGQARGQRAADREQQAGDGERDRDRQRGELPRSTLQGPQRFGVQRAGAACGAAARGPAAGR